MVQPRGRSEKMPITIGLVQFEIEQARPMKQRSAASARKAISALFVANGFAFGVWSAHISVFKQNYQLSNAQLTIPLFTLALGAILSMPFVGRVFHRIDSSRIAWSGQICYAAMLSLLPWTRSLTWLAIGTFCFGLLRGTVDVSTNAQAIITERAYGSAVMSGLQGFWSLGGLMGAAFSSVLLRQHSAARQNLFAAAVCMIVTILISKRYLLNEDRPVDPPAGWVLIPRALWALAAVAFLCFFIEGAIGDWGTVYLRSTLHLSAATAATGYAVFSLSMMTGCFIGDQLTMKLGATNLLRASGALVAFGFGFALLGTTYFGDWLSFCRFWLVQHGCPYIRCGGAEISRRSRSGDRGCRQRRLFGVSGRAASGGIFVRSARAAGGTGAGGRSWRGYLLFGPRSDGGDRVMGKKQLPYLSALSPEVTAAFSGGVDLSTTVLVLDGCPMFASAYMGRKRISSNAFTP
jgi:hypothetical protein